VHIVNDTAERLKRIVQERGHATPGYDAQSGSAGSVSEELQVQLLDAITPP
jgi:hypothetical protein